MAPAAACSWRISAVALVVAICSSFSTWVKVAVWAIICDESTGFEGSW
jgi:hypothetical protein